METAIAGLLFLALGILGLLTNNTVNKPSKKEDKSKLIYSISVRKHD